MPTTSHPSRRSSRSKTDRIAQANPLKSIRLTVTLVGVRRAQLERLAAEKGLSVKEKGGDLTISFAAASPEEALAQLRLLGSLLSPKG